MNQAHAQSVSAGPITADTGNPYLDAGIVLIIALAIAVAVQLVRVWLVKHRWLR